MADYFSHQHDFPKGLTSLEVNELTFQVGKDIGAEVSLGYVSGHSTWPIGIISKSYGSEGVAWATLTFAQYTEEDKYVSLTLTSTIPFERREEVIKKLDNEVGLSLDKILKKKDSK